MKILQFQPRSIARQIEEEILDRERAIALTMMAEEVISDLDFRRMLEEPQSDDAVDPDVGTQES